MAPATLGHAAGRYRGRDLGLSCGRFWNWISGESTFGRRRVAVEITGLTSSATLAFIEAILEPFSFDDARRDIVLGNFRKEIGEIGTNRIILVG